MKAIFLDRDSVINEPYYNEELGTLDSPTRVEQFRLIPRVGEAVAMLNKLGIPVVLITNQPSIAKGKITVEGLDEIHAKMEQELAKDNAKIDKIYYCPHHPEGKVEEYTKECECRKPKPGMLKQAAQEMDIDLAQSYMVGDDWKDVKAGEAAGCKTILVGKHIEKCDFCRLMQEKGAKPTYIVKDLYEAAQKIASLEA